MELIVGATGYVGGRLLERLSAEGRELRALARDSSRLAARSALDVVHGDLVEGTGLERALEGCDTAYYLAHSMDVTAGRGFGVRDRVAARNFARAAHAAGLERVVYLSGLIPEGVAPSPHLASRLEVERILLDAVPLPTTLRTSIIVGARSAPFRILVRLVERLRVLPFPAWRDHVTQPIDERDAIDYLARTPATPTAAGRSLDIAGADVLSYGEMIERIAELMGVGRSPLRLGFNQTPATSAVVASLTGQPLQLVRPLMESLDHDLLPRDDAARELYGITPRRFDAAVEHALAEWERTEELGAR